MSDPRTDAVALAATRALAAAIEHCDEELRDRIKAAMPEENPAEQWFTFDPLSGEFTMTNKGRLIVRIDLRPLLNSD